jgi:type I restriction-modification system DNA methylase subunit
MATKKSKPNDSAATVGYEAQLWQMADALRGSDRHPDLKADFIPANPPFNISDWGGERLRDKRRQYGAPPAGSPPLRSSQADCRSDA